jgi:hypothetical protein
MNADSIRFDLLFDADEYDRSGCCPWTFFAYPTILADDRGLPPDNEACELLSLLQKRGIAVAVWINGINNTTYFACRREDMHTLHDALQQLETQGMIEKDFCGVRTERLFAQIAEETVQMNKPNSSGDTANEDESHTRSLAPAHAAYNIVTDTVTGVNVRWSDNKFQAIFVFVSILLASLTGAVLAALNARWNLPWYGGALIGSFAGLVIGIFASGTFLMFYRAVMHVNGKHD